MAARPQLYLSAAQTQSLGHSQMEAIGYRLKYNSSAAANLIIDHY